MSGLETLFLNISKETGDFFPRTLQDSERVFGHLMGETKPDRVFAMRADSDDSDPPGLREMAEERGFELKTRLIDRIDPLTWSGSQNPSTIWSDQLIRIVEWLELSEDEGSLHFHVGSGSGWHASLFYALRGVLGGGKLWITRRTEEGMVAEEVSWKGPFSEPATATMAALAKNRINGVNRVRLVGKVEGVPAPGGVEKALRGHDELVTSTDSEGVVEYELTPAGKYHSMVCLGVKHRPTIVQGGRRGVVVFVRSVKSVIEIISDYLTLQPGVRIFDNFAFFVGAYGDNSPARLETSEQIHSKAKELLGAHAVLSSPADPTVDFGGPLLDGYVDTLTWLHKLRGDNPGVEWTVDLTHLVAEYRAPALEYAYWSGLDAIWLAKNPPPESDTSGVLPSGLSGSKHALKIPGRKDLEEIRTIIGSSKPVQSAVVSGYLIERLEPGEKLGFDKKEYGSYRLYEWNRANLPPDHPCRLHDIPDANIGSTMSRAKNKGFRIGALADSGSPLVLTPSGVVAGSILLYSWE